MPTLDPQVIVLGFIWFIVFLFSTTCHEAAHALVAKIGGDPTAFHGGAGEAQPDSPHPPGAVRDAAGAPPFFLLCPARGGVGAAQARLVPPPVGGGSLPASRV